MIRHRPSISAAEWNAMLRDIQRTRVLHTMALPASVPMAHSWHTRVSWDAAEKQWQAIVRPGFVNGIDPTARVPGDDGELVDRSLTDAPFIPLAAGWRRIGADAAPEASTVAPDGSVTLSFEPVPDFFLARGVQAKQITTISADDPQVLAALTPGETTRRLRAQDIVLHRERPGLASDQEGRPVLVVPPGARRDPYVRVTRRFEVAMAADDPLAWLAGDWEQGTRDSELVCTVFMLSPENVAEDAAVDETWTPFVQHELFWNLSYAHNLPVFSGGNAFTLQTGLAGGVGDEVIRQILDSNNKASQQALDFLATHQVEGRFWSI